MGLLSGLEKFGFRSMEKVNVYEEEEKEGKKKVERAKPKKTLSELTEPELLFDKAYTCPVCEKELKVKAVRMSKVKLISTDVDLRWIHQNVDTLKYGAVLCTGCGYAALTNYFSTISDPQIRLINENITTNYSPKPESEEEIYSYDKAIEIHKMALLNAVVKKGKASEKAYICLKTAWLYRGKRELLESGDEVKPEEIEELKKEEQECLDEAYKGFLNAISTESTATICGMDGATVTYLCAALAYELERYDEAKRLVSKVYGMNDVKRSIKEKCTNLKELIAEKSA